MTVQRDYYDILGVSRTATAEEIKKAFRKKAKEHHPDTSQDPNAEALFKELGEAYDVLSDSQKRQVYDTYGHDGLKSGGYTSPNWDFMEGFPDLSDIFASIFGGGGFGYSGRRRYGPQQGDDLRLDLDLAFMDAAFGAKREIDVTRLEHCETCNGSGAAPGSGPAACTTCGGNGQVRQTAQTIIGHFTQIVTCPRCHGQGMTIVDPCRTCNGRGRKQGSKKLTLSIPPGVDTGTRLRVAGEGDAGPLGGPPGDLYVVVQIKPHPVFKREGYNVVSVRKVAYATLALGSEIEVPTLDGAEKLRVPAGTQNGHVFTLKGAGVPHLNNPDKRGDHFVQVQIEVPTRLSGEERKLLERLAEIQAERDKHNAPATATIFDRFKEALSGST